MLLILVMFSFIVMKLFQIEATIGAGKERVANLKTDLENHKMATERKFADIDNTLMALLKHTR